jgi:Leucine-rich repeat (LRR) protein
MKKRIVLYSVVLIFFLYIGINQNLSAQVFEKDSLALVALYDSTYGANWTDNTNWLTEPVSTWFGVTVDDTSVIEIELVNNNLSGTIPPQIGNLINLNTLDLGNNNLFGPIPLEISALVNLKILRLYKNQLSGSIPIVICNNLKKLEILFIRQNNLSGTIPPEIGNLTNIKTLVLGYDDLSGSIPNEIGDLKKLETLAIQSTKISGEIPVEIYGLTNLRYLGLYRNYLSGTLSDSIGNLINLQTLNVFSTQISGTIPANINKLQKLREINISNNNLLGTIPPSLWDLTELTNLSLYSNQLTGTIPEELGQLQKLTVLNLFNNQFSGAIPEEINMLQGLRQLYIDHNEFNQLPDLSMLSVLGWVRIQNNQFTFEDIESNIGIDNFTYSPQDSIGVGKDTTVTKDSSLVLSVSLGGTANLYQWTKDGVDIPGADSSSNTIESVDSSDAGSYICKITNTIATELTIYSRSINVTVESTTGIANQLSQIPKGFVLYQNYPNPFNPSTTIKFALAKSEDVKIEVFNTLGQKVRALINKTMPAGYHEVEFSSQNLPSGIYIYMIEAGQFQGVKKMLYLK